MTPGRVAANGRLVLNLWRRAGRLPSADRTESTWLFFGAGSFRISFRPDLRTPGINLRRFVMTHRHFPVRPNLVQLKHQAKELLRQLHAEDPFALADFTELFQSPKVAGQAKLADAQFLLARIYGLPSWSRLVVACQLTHAIWQDDRVTVKKLLLENPKLIFEDARGVEGNWGRPMSYAASVGRDEIVKMCFDLGAEDVQFAFERACLQGRLATAELLSELGGSPRRGAVMGPCETLNAEGLKFLLEHGAEFCDESGDRLAPVGMILQTYCRSPKGKHGCLELAARQGIHLPDSPVFGMHRGRIDLLEACLARDPGMLSRTFTHREIFPDDLGCSSDETLALCGTPLGGGTLLHMAIDYDEVEIFDWLLEYGASPNARASVNGSNETGHTPLFNAVVCQTAATNLRNDDYFARKLLDHGADTQIRASLSKALRFVEDESLHTYHQVTALEWGREFHDQQWVNRDVLKLLASIQVSTEP